MHRWIPRLVTKKCVIPLKITTNYNDFGKIQYILASERIDISDTRYGKM